MYSLPPDRACWPAVGDPLERRVRPRPPLEGRDLSLFFGRELCQLHKCTVSGDNSTINVWHQATIQCHVDHPIHHTTHVVVNPQWREAN